MIHGTGSAAAPEPTERPLPQNLDAERSVLGAILLDREIPNVALSKARERLKPEDFSDHHRRIFTQMIKLDEAEHAVDLVTLTDKLHREGELEAAGGSAYISQLSDGVPRVTYLEHYCTIVKENSKRRKLVRTARAIEEQARDAEDDADTVAARAQESIATIAEAKLATDKTIRLVDMPDTVLDGRLGEIYQRRLNDFPRAYGYLALVGAASVRVEPPSAIPTNVYAPLVGPVGTGKSQAIERALATLGLGPPEVQPLMAGSGEGLLKKLEGANGAPRLVSVDEFSHLLEKSKLKGASFPALLCRAYYARRFDLTVAGGKEVHVNCSLTLLGGIVDANFQDCFGAATVFGLYDRCLFGQCPAPYEYSYRPFEGLSELAEPRKIIVTPEVWEARDEWVRTIPGMSHRIAEHALRVAAICASWDQRQILRANDLRPSRALAEYQVRARGLLQPNPGENADARCAFAITNALDGLGWVNRRRLYRSIHGYRFGPRVFDNACASLVFNGEIKTAEKGQEKLVRLVSIEGAP